MGVDKIVVYCVENIFGFSTKKMDIEFYKCFENFIEKAKRFI